MAVKLYDVKGSVDAVTDCFEEFLKYLKYMQEEVVRMIDAGDTIDTDEIVEYADSVYDDIKYLEKLLEAIYKVADEINDCAY